MKIVYAVLDPEQSMQIYMHRIHHFAEGTIENLYKAITQFVVKLNYNKLPFNSGSVMATENGFCCHDLELRYIKLLQTRGDNVQV